MSAAQGPRELVLCHLCHNEWWKDERGLECSQCHNDIVEIITPRDDPRNEHTGFRRHDDGDALPHQRLRDHNPWRDNPLDPDEEDIDRVAFSPAPGVHFSRTTIRSNGRAGQRSRTPMDDIMGSVFQAFGNVGAGFPPGGPGRARDEPMQARSGSMMFINGQRVSPNSPLPNSLPHHHPHVSSGGSWPPNSRDGTRDTWATEDRIFPEDMPHHRPTNDPLIGINAIMSTLFASMQANQVQHPHQRGRTPPAGSPGAGAFSIPDFLQRMMDPSNAVHGDHALTQEAFDRIIGQMMDTNASSTAPGPASPAAIAALPRKKIDKSMLGSDGKAECSVCMDNVDVGEEMTFLPCNHWFHEQCVGIWLKEHDTCPHCRKGIMPANGEADQPRTPNQPPINFQDPFGPDNYAERPPHIPPGTFTQAIPPQPPNQGPWIQPGMQQPYVPGGYPSYPEPGSYVQPQPDQLQPTLIPPHGQHRPPHRPSSSSRRHSSSGQHQSRGQDEAGSSNGGGGLSGWFRGLRGGSGRSSEP